MPLLCKSLTPKKKYALLSTVLFAGWTLNSGVSDEARNRMVFEKDGYTFGLMEREVILFPPGHTEGIRRPYSLLSQHHGNQGFILNITENLDSFDLRDTEKGLQPAIEVHRAGWFKPMQGLLTRFRRNYRRPPNTTEFIYWLRRHRKQFSLPGDTARLHRLIKLGNYNFWVLEQKIDESGKRIEILPLRGKLR